MWRISESSRASKRVKTEKDVTWLAPVVQKVDGAIYWIACERETWSFSLSSTYLLDKSLLGIVDKSIQILNNWGLIEGIWGTTAGFLFGLHNERINFHSLKSPVDFVCVDSQISTSNRTPKTDRKTRAYMWWWTYLWLQHPAQFT